MPPRVLAAQFALTLLQVCYRLSLRTRFNSPRLLHQVDKHMRAGFSSQCGLSHGRTGVALHEVWPGPGAKARGGAAELLLLNLYVLLDQTLSQTQLRNRE